VAHAASPPERSERLWLGARAHLNGGQAPRAVPLLRKFLEAGLMPEHAGEGWYLLGVALLAVGDRPGAEQAFKRCVEDRSAGKFAFRAFYQLSQIELGKGNTGPAEDILVQNVRRLQENPDPEALEASLYALGSLRYRRKRYQDARTALEDATARFPASPAAPRARLELADIYRRLARQEEEIAADRTVPAQARDLSERQGREWWLKAAASFGELARAVPPPLSAREQTEAALGEPECLFNAGRYAEALVLCETLARRFREPADQIRALAGALRCYSAFDGTLRHLYTREPYLAADLDRHFQRRVWQTRLALRGVDGRTRASWQAWLLKARRRADGPAQARSTTP
jgi:TolA-binding protein